MTQPLGANDVSDVMKSTGGEGGVMLKRLLDAAFRQLQHDTGQHDKEYVFQRTVLAEEFAAILRSCAQDAPGVGAALARTTAILDRLYEGGPDCDCSMDGGAHTCGWPELKGARTQAHAALSRVPPAPAGDAALRAAASRACDVLATLYAVYGTKIGPYSSQAQQCNVELSAALRSPPDVPWTASGCAPELLGKTLTENLREISAHMYSLRWKAYAETMEKAVDMIRETLFPDADTREEDALVAELINRRREYKLSEYQAKLLRSLAQRLRGAAVTK